MKVKKIEWISRDAKEAIVFIGDHEFECAAFCQPCECSAGDEFTEPLIAYGVQGIHRKEQLDSLLISRQGREFGHDIVATVVAPKDRMVTVGSILIELDIPLPADIVANDVVEFSCSRLDA